MIKKIYCLIVAVVFILASGVAAATASEDDEKWYEGKITVGGTTTLEGLHSDDSGSKGGLEYNAVVGKKWTTVLGGELDVDKDGWAFSFDGLYRDVNEQDYEGMLSLQRVLVIKTDYTSMYHRLGHDYLENLEAHACSGSGGCVQQSPRTGTDPDTGITYDTEGQNTVGTASVYHTDTDPTEMYAIHRSLWENEIDFHIPQIPELTLSFNHRYEEREGDQQALTNSKCRSCHIVSSTQWVSEQNHDLGPKLALKIGTMAMEYSYMHREFSIDSDEMRNLYNNTMGPTTLGGDREDFLNRVQYNSSSGELPYSEVPESTRDKHNAKFRWDVNGHNTFVASYVYSENKNTSTDEPYDILTGNYGDDISLKSSTVSAKFTSHVTHGLTLNFFGKFQDLDNDEVDIEKIQLANSYTAAGGDTMTLAEGYIAHGEDPETVYEYLNTSYERQSGYDSNNWKLGLNAAWRILHGLKLKGEYEYGQEKRDNYDIHHVPETTSEHLIKLSGDYHLGHSLKFGLDYKMAFVDDAYRLKHATCTPDSSYGVYGVKTGSTSAAENQYVLSRAYETAIYGERTGDRSNQPDMFYEVKFKTNWQAMRTLSTNLHVKYRYSQNDEVDGSDWNQNFVLAGLNVLANPIKNLTISGGYNYFYDKYESMYCIAIYDG